MSDTNRQSLIDKAGAALKPDSQKTFGGVFLLFGSDFIGAADAPAQRT